METQKLIFVTGGTGKLGASVARHLANEGFKVRVLTRNPTSSTCIGFGKLAIECVKGDLNDLETYREYVRGAYGVFGVLSPKNGVKSEVAQGKILANLSYQFGVKHFIYSSVAGAERDTGIPHFESKKEIEDHIKKIGLPYTIIRPAYFFENFLTPDFKMGIFRGICKQATSKETRVQYVSCEDVGELVKRAFVEPERFLYKTIPVAAEELGPEEVAEVFSEELHKTIEYKKLPWVVTRFMLGKNEYKMVTWLNSGNRLVDMEEVRSLGVLENPLKLRTWITQNYKRDARP